MSAWQGSFRPDELDGPGERLPQGDRAAALTTARELMGALPVGGVQPTAEFVDRVMAALAAEPAPRAGGFLAAPRSRPGLPGLLLSVRQAWTVATGGPGRPIGARGAALAYVLAVALVGVSLTGAAALGTAGVLRLLDPNGTTNPSLVEPSPSPEPTLGLVQPPSPVEASESPEPSESAEASESPEPADASSGTSAGLRPTESPGSSDDHGDHESPSPDDSGHGGSDSPSGSPRPSETPKPSETPH